MPPTVRQKAVSMKVIVQIPCYNEEETLPQTVADIPRRIDGVDEVEILVIDDGSTDRTVEVARRLGVDHIVRNRQNKGLAATFLVGLDACLRLGADIIVNTDGDNQYRGSDIPRLIRPILDGTAEFVVGDRQTDSIDHFSWSKKKLQKFGSFVVRMLSGADIPDAVSGFRALSREAALQMNIVSAYSYTIETIIQASKKRIALASTPVGTNAKTRESRLFKSVPKFIVSQLNTIVRMYTMYQPLKAFWTLGAIFIAGGLIPCIRYLFFYLQGQGSGHIQSLILSVILFILGGQVMILGIVSDVTSFNRRLIEDALLRIKKIELHLCRTENSSRKQAP